MICVSPLSALSPVPTMSHAKLYMGLGSSMDRQSTQANSGATFEDMQHRCVVVLVVDLDGTWDRHAAIDAFAKDHIDTTHPA